MNSILSAGNREEGKKRMAENTVFIYGQIGLDTTVQSVLEQMRDFAPASDVTVKIHSPGGSVYEGFAIHELLVNSGHNITTQGEGLIGSIATVIFLAGKYRKLTENSRFFIHMPLVPPGKAGGNATDLREIADKLEEWESIIIDFYAQRTKTGKRKLKDLLNAETEMSASEAFELGFATEILTPVLALAKIDKNFQMKSLSEIIAKVTGAGDKPEIEALNLSTNTGATLHINTKDSKPALEDSVTIDGKSAEDGMYEIPSEEIVLHVKDGKISNIEEKIAEIPLEAFAEELANDYSTFKTDITAKLDPVFENQVSQGETLAATLKKVGELEAKLEGFKELENKFDTLLQELANLEAQSDTQKEEIAANKEILEKAREIQSNYVPQSEDKGDKAPANPLQAKMKEIYNQTKKY